MYVAAGPRGVRADRELDRAFVLDVVGERSGLKRAVGSPVCCGALVRVVVTEGDPAQAAVAYALDRRGGDVVASVDAEGHPDGTARSAAGTLDRADDFGRVVLDADRDPYDSSHEVVELLGCKLFARVAHRPRASVACHGRVQYTLHFDHVGGRHVHFPRVDRRCVRCVDLSPL